MRSVFSHHCVKVIERKFPAPLEDLLVRWAWKNINSKNLSGVTVNRLPKAMGGKGRWRRHDIPCGGHHRTSEDRSRKYLFFWRVGIVGPVRQVLLPPLLGRKGDSINVAGARNIIPNSRLRRFWPAGGTHATLTTIAVATAVAATTVTAARLLKTKQKTAVSVMSHAINKHGGHWKLTAVATLLAWLRSVPCCAIGANCSTRAC